MSYIGFNAQGVDTRDEFSPLPAGSYNVIITDTEVRQTKNGSGTYLSLKMEIQSGEFHGRKLFHNITLSNQNLTAVSIGQKHLAQICHAIGIMQVNDSSELHYKPLIAVVRIRKGDGQYGDSNEVQRYEAVQAPAAGFQPPAQAKPAQPAPAAAPWAASR